MPVKKYLDITKSEKLLAVLKKRFEKNTFLHPNIQWDMVEEKLKAREDILLTICSMEETGGEPDLVTDIIEDVWLYVDTCPESPKERSSLCYDQSALLSRKKNPPQGSVEKMAEDIGGELLDEKLYRKLQKKFEFDRKSSSWIKTDGEIRELGGALFCHRRYGRVFLFHNGADSYYASRGFRLMVRL